MRLRLGFCRGIFFYGARTKGGGHPQGVPLRVRSQGVLSLVDEVAPGVL